jgi:hypothetical protein
LLRSIVILAAALSNSHFDFSIFRVVGGADEAILVRQVESGNGLRFELEVGS